MDSMSDAPTVLIVDDEPGIVDSLHKIFERESLRVLEAKGLPVATINKVLEGRPHVVDALKNGEINLVFNTTDGAQALADSSSIRRAALTLKVPYYTTMAGAAAATQAIQALRSGSLEVAPLQSYSLGCTAGLNRNFSAKSVP